MAPLPEELVNYWRNTFPEGQPMPKWTVVIEHTGENYNQYTLTGELTGFLNMKFQVTNVDSLDSGFQQMARGVTLQLQSGDVQLAKPKVKKSLLKPVPATGAVTPTSISTDGFLETGNYVSLLNECVQQKWKKNAVFEEEATATSDAKRPSSFRFRVTCGDWFDEKPISGCEEGKSKNEAKKRAAYQALKMIKEKYGVDGMDRKSSRGGSTISHDQKFTPGEEIQTGKDYVSILNQFTLHKWRSARITYDTTEHDQGHFVATVVVQEFDAERVMGGNDPPRRGKQPSKNVAAYRALEILHKEVDLNPVINGSRGDSRATKNVSQTEASKSVVYANHGSAVVTPLAPVVEAIAE